MKKFVTLLLVLVTVLPAISQSKYERSMQSGIDAIDSSETLEDYLALANKFERIGAAEKKALPYYYAAYCHVLASTEEDNTKIDVRLNVVESKINEAELLGGLEAELLVLRGFAAMLRITVDPAVRGQEYSMKSVEYLQRAKQIENQNPRALLMLGQMQYGSAQFFGSGIEDACNTFKSVVQLFEMEEQQERGLLPTWGKKQAEYMQIQCDQKEDNN